MKKIKKTLVIALLVLCLALPLVLSSCFLKKTPPADGSGHNTVNNEVIAALTKQNIESVSLDGKIQVNNDSNVTLSYGVTGTANFADRAADISFDISGGAPENADSISYWEHLFVRDWIGFGSGTDREKKDPAKLEYDDGGDLLEAFEDQLSIPDEFRELYPKYLKYALNLFGYNVNGNSAEAVLASSVNFFNAVIISIADAANATTKADGVLSIDLPKAIKTLIDDRKALIDSLNENTTVKDALNHEIRRKYMERLTCTMTPEKVQDKLFVIINSLRKDFQEELPPDFLDKLQKVISIKPDADSSAYQYLVKLTTSKEFLQLMDIMSNGEISQHMNVNKDLGNTKITELYGGASIAEIKQVLKDQLELDLQDLGGISSDGTTISFTDWGSGFLNITKTKFEYTLNANNTVAALHAEADFSEFNYGQTLNGTVNGTLTFSDKKAELRNVNNFKVVKEYEYHYADGKNKSEYSDDYKYLLLDYYYDYDYGFGSYDVSAYPIMKNDKLDDFEVRFFDRWGERKIPHTYNKQTKELTVVLNGTTRVFEIKFEQDNLECYENGSLIDRIWLDYSSITPICCTFAEYLAANKTNG